MSVFLWASFAFFASVHAQDEFKVETVQAGLASEHASQSQGSIDTQKPNTKLLYIGKAVGTIPKWNKTRNGTIAPRHDPRQLESPELAYPASTPYSDPWVTKTINHDEVKPFTQPSPVTISEKAGVKFKPQIQIRTGCVSYPAVNDVGETSGGLQTSGSPKGGCRGSDLGSQNAIVFLDNPAVPEPRIMACSVSSHNGYYKYNPCPPWVIDGTSLKLRYKHEWPKNHDLDVTGDAGTFQDLIMWDQMTDDARRALNSASFGKANTPINDGTFPHKLKDAWPF
ncbi:Necrosis inducing protein NPP1 [Phytophthora megakarya]|uniref:Necrosis inducing protein NPP1 n=1 Tax=Phytophthora megakarya TaxID=4795 RepID=A0A225W6D4_9STRA|nr:Necrosis inducing protein NPP1 [Phytophthora megakarya]